MTYQELLNILTQKEKKHIYFCSKLGAGKTTVLMQISKELANNYNRYGIIPLFVDLSQANENKPITSYLLENYNGKLTYEEKCNDINREAILRECLNDTKYRFLLILDSTELLSETTDDNVIKELGDYNEFTSLSIVYSTCNKSRKNETIFADYETIENFGVFDEIHIINYLNNNDFHISQISSSWAELLNTPFFLTKFVKLYKDTDIDLTLDQSIGKSKLMEDYLYTFVRLNLPSEDNDDYKSRKLLVFRDIPKKLFERNSTNIFMPLEEGRYLKNLPSIRIKEELSDEYECEITHLIHFHFNIAKHISNVFEKARETESLTECVELLNSRIFEEETLSYLGEQLALTNENRTESQLYECISYIRSNCDVTNYQVAVSNILNIFILSCSVQLVGFDLSCLDLRKGCFIGVNCVGVNFSNTIVRDECFMPIEPENSNIFAVSPLGNYYLTGNKKIINLRFADNDNVERFYNDSDNDFICIHAVDGKEFQLIRKNTIDIYKLKRGKIISFRQNTRDNHSNKYEKHILEKINMIDIANVKNIHIDGEVCSVSKNKEFALVKNKNNYQIWNCKNKKKKCQHFFRKTHRITAIRSIVKRGDIIEFIPINDGKPLKTVVYDARNNIKMILHYSSLQGKYIQYNSDTKIYFDTENFNNLCKWRFHQWKYMFKANDITAPPVETIIPISNCVFPVESKSAIIHTKHYIEKFEYNGCSYGYTKNKGNYATYEISSKNIAITHLGNNSLKFISRQAPNDEIEVSLKDLGLSNSVFDMSNINFKDFMIDDRIELILANRRYVYDLTHHKLLGGEELSLQFTDEYKSEIENLTWQQVAKKFLKMISSEDYQNKSYHEQVECGEELIAPYVSNKNFAHPFACYLTDFFTWSDCEQDLPSNYEFIIGINNWCFPCDEGVIYYDGEYTCYLREKDGQRIENRFVSGSHLVYCRNGVHHSTTFNKFSNCYRLYDIYKSDSENKEANLSIPIYDLECFQAKFDGAKGLSGFAIDIINQYTAMPTAIFGIQNKIIVLKESD